MDGGHRKTLLVETKRRETHQKGRVHERVGDGLEYEDKAAGVRFHEDEHQRRGGAKEDTEKEELRENRWLPTSSAKEQDPVDKRDHQGGGGGNQDGQDQRLLRGLHLHNSLAEAVLPSWSRVINCPPCPLSLWLLAASPTAKSVPV